MPFHLAMAVADGQSLALAAALAAQLWVGAQGAGTQDTATEEAQDSSNLSVLAIVGIAVGIFIILLSSFVLVYKCKQGAQEEADYEAIKAQRAERYERATRQNPEQESLLYEDRESRAVAAAKEGSDLEADRTNGNGSLREFTDDELREIARRQALQRLNSPGFRVDQY
ncbi:Hypothetical Protein FCC1311_039652 [Hondaea fermentalgiana]|uniref:Uncharacterized protein n=1 Tax=Hondaea fermentalgiana TaxID=2315210 RepID=A0A2R5G9K3_9STRA|nr:Hypothetical Protein FCC1311_039652 [Hondaea fermentalgiana]|eukprot:GBG27742.1 Hypothetical Protein FCC1311_039652 [Hondaea fermentalgiana]